MNSNNAINPIDGLSPDSLYLLDSDIPEFVKQICKCDTRFVVYYSPRFEPWTPALVAVLNPDPAQGEHMVEIFEKRAPARFYELKIHPPGGTLCSISFGSCEPEFVVQLAYNLANNVLSFHCHCV
jgi:hypothetical protein